MPGDSDKHIPPVPQRRVEHEEKRGGYESGSRPVTKFPPPSTGVKKAEPKKDS